MQLVEANPKSLSYVKQYRTRYKLWHLVDQFMMSDMNAAEIQFNPNEYKSPCNLRYSLEQAVRRINAPCEVFMRDSKVYLIKKSAVEELSKDAE